MNAAPPCPAFLRCAAVLAAALLEFARCAGAADYYVATNGNDGASGALATPWRTLQHAVDRAAAGDRVIVRRGAYRQRVVFHRSGLPAAAITLTNYPSEQPAIDGRELAVAGSDALVQLNGQSHIAISGFVLRNFRTAARDAVPMGVLVSGNSTNIRLSHLVIHHIEANFDDGGAPVAGADAHGIAVYGTHPTEPASGIVIEDVTIRDCRLGSSEALVLNGNVDGFLVRRCRVQDNNNIGVGVIGHEGTCPTPALDRARNGICAGNRVYNISTAGNPAYRRGAGSFDRSAGGIYVDGGASVVIERNIVHDCDIGIEVASEWDGKSAANVTVRNNFIYRNFTGGIFAGGYAADRGGARNCRFIGNTLFSNDTARSYSGEICLQFHVLNCAFENNLVYALRNEGGTAVFVGGPGGAGSAPSNTTFDCNLYFSRAASSSWTWGNAESSSFSQWTSRGHDANGIFGRNPLLVAPSQGNLHIADDSPARDRGHTRTDVGAVDVDGQARVVGAAVDIGADELPTATARIATAILR